MSSIGSRGISKLKHPRVDKIMKTTKMSVLWTSIIVYTSFFITGLPYPSNMSVLRNNIEIPNNNDTDFFVDLQELGDDFITDEDGDAGKYAIGGPHLKSLVESYMLSLGVETNWILAVVKMPVIAHGTDRYATVIELNDEGKAMMDGYGLNATEGKSLNFYEQGRQIMSMYTFKNQMRGAKFGINSFPTTLVRISEKSKLMAAKIVQTLINATGLTLQDGILPDLIFEACGEKERLTRVEFFADLSTVKTVFLQNIIKNKDQMNFFLVEKLFRFGKYTLLAAAYVQPGRGVQFLFGESADKREKDKNLDFMAVEIQISARDEERCTNKTTVMSKYLNKIYANRRCISCNSKTHDSFSCPVKKRRRDLTDRATEVEEKRAKLIDQGRKLKSSKYGYFRKVKSNLLSFLIYFRKDWFHCEIRHTSSLLNNTKIENNTSKSSLFLSVKSESIELKKLSC